MGKSVSGRVLFATTLLMVPLLAHAAGLGKVTVQSQLGQPLSAEIEIVSLLPGEEQSLVARLAPGDAFAQAGIEFNNALLGVRFAIERRNGKPFIRMTSTQPVNEPFLELLVEMQWATGRLVREYSFLLDPPDYRAPRPVVAKPAPGVEVRPASAAAAKPEERPIAAPAQPAAPARPGAGVPAGQAGAYEVKPGDTLFKVARENVRPGVTMQQMLAALYRSNQDAFIDGNMNRLRSGQILRIPDPAAVASVDPAEAARLLSAQAGQPSEASARPASAAPAAPQRESRGAVENKPAARPADQGDQLRLSKADGKQGPAKAARRDDTVARERALSDAQSRVSELERNVGDLQKLLELKNQQLAQLEAKAGGRPVPPKPEAPKAEPVKAEPAKADAPKPEAKAQPSAASDAAKAGAAVADPAKAPPPSAAETASADTAKAEAPKAPEPAKSEEPKKAKPKAAAPPPPPPPSMLDEFLDNPVALGGLGGVAALLLGYGAWAWRRKKAAQASQLHEGVPGGPGAGGAASILSAGAASAEPSPPSVPQGAAQGETNLAAGEPDEVDPIAEAEVYIAYGRDAQAEEILKEALARDPERPVVFAKLLEIYANRRDVKSFEDTALKLKALTAGEGEDWDRAAALGRSIDPSNGLYAGAGEPAAAPALAPEAEAPALDFDVGGAAAAQTAAPADLTLEPPSGSSEPAAAALDFDIGGLGEPAPAEEKTEFSPGGTMIVDSTELRPAAPAGGLDFDLDLGEPASSNAGPAATAEPAATVSAAESAGAAADNAMDFKLDFDLGSDLAGAGATPAPVAEPPLDLSSLSLDLGAPSADAAAEASAGGEKWQEVATKLDLAKAYEEMGDHEGARDLLKEVLLDGDAAQQAQAKQMLAALG